MSDRELDQQLVERVQRGDKQAVRSAGIRYQRFSNRLLSRLIRDLAVVEDVAQETFIKALLSAVCSGVTALSKAISGCTASASTRRRTTGVSRGRRALTLNEFLDSEEAETEEGDQLRRHQHA